MTLTARAHSLLIVIEVVAVIRRPVRIGISGRYCVRAHGGDPGVGRSRLLHQVLDVPGGVRDGVLAKADRRRVLEARLLAHLRPDQAGGTRERCLSPGHLIVRAVDGVEHRRLAQVARDSRLGNCHEAKPWVLDSPLQHLRDYFRDPIPELAGPGLVHGRLTLLASEAAAWRRATRSPAGPR